MAYFHVAASLFLNIIICILCTSETIALKNIQRIEIRGRNANKFEETLVSTTRRLQDHDGKIDLKLTTENQSLEFLQLERLTYRCPISPGVRVGSSLESDYINYECSTFSNDNYTVLLTVKEDDTISGLVAGGSETNFLEFHSTSAVSFEYNGEESGTSSFNISIHEGDIVVEEHALDDDEKASKCGLGLNNSIFEWIPEIPSDLLESGVPLDREANSSKSQGRNLAVEQWENCYENDNVPHKLVIGVGIGSMYAKNYGNKRKKILKSIETILAKTNMVFSRQLNLFIEVGNIIILNEESNDNWNNPASTEGSKKCSKSIFQQFRDWKNTGLMNGATRMGTWHLLDDCHDPASAVGIAYNTQGSLCEYLGYSLTYVSKDTWLTFAHETGHNLGAQHSFEEGKGKTGGIMDYGDKKFEGQYQFNSQYRQKEMCAHIRSHLSSCGNNFLPLDTSSSCGNGRIDDGEECECPGGETSCQCCNKCRLRENVDCSPFLNECCTNECSFKPASSDTMCTTLDGIEGGYCSNGVCENSCQKWEPYVQEPCGVHEDNSCRFSCMRHNRCNKLTGWTTADKDLNLVVDNTKCIIPNTGGETGYCSSGFCVASSDIDGLTDIESTTGQPTGLPTGSPTGSPSRNQTGDPIKEEGAVESYVETNNLPVVAGVSVAFLALCLLLAFVLSRPRVEKQSSFSSTLRDPEVPNTNQKTIYPLTRYFLGKNTSQVPATISALHLKVEDAEDIEASLSVVQQENVVGRSQPESLDTVVVVEPKDEVDVYVSSGCTDDTIAEEGVKAEGAVQYQSESDVIAELLDTCLGSSVTENDTLDGDRKITVGVVNKIDIDRSLGVAVPISTPQLEVNKQSNVLLQKTLKESEPIKAQEVVKVDGVIETDFETFDTQRHIPSNFKKGLPSESNNSIEDTRDQRIANLMLPGTENFIVSETQELQAEEPISRKMDGHKRSKIQEKINAEIQNDLSVEVQPKQGGKENTTAPQSIRPSSSPEKVNRYRRRSENKPNMPGVKAIIRRFEKSSRNPKQADVRSSKVSRITKNLERNIELHRRNKNLKIEARRGNGDGAHNPLNSVKKIRNRIQRSNLTRNRSSSIQSTGSEQSVSDLRQLFESSPPPRENCCRLKKSSASSRLDV